MPTNFITLPRSQLYELVWSRPVTELAKEFGISDVALAKRCRALNIPLPDVGERGVFTTRLNVSSSARTPAHGCAGRSLAKQGQRSVTAGPKPRRPPLPPFRERRRSSLPSYVSVSGAQDSRGVEHEEVSAQTVTRQGRSSASSQGRVGHDERGDNDVPAGPQRGMMPERCGAPGVSGEERSSCSTPEVAILFGAPRKPDPADTEPVSAKDAALHARIDALSIAPLATLADAHPAVLRTAVRLKQLKSREITWPRGTRTGPILEITRVSEPQQERALRILDAVVRGAESLGWPFEAPPPELTTDRRQTFARSSYVPPVYGQLLVEGESVTLRIDERNRQSDHVMTDQEKADKKAGRYLWTPRFDYAPSGELRLHATEPAHSYTSATWKDTKRHPLETQIRKILHGLLTIALERKQHREEERLHEIAEREAERQREIVRQRRAANEDLIHTLEAEAGAWARARFLRRYLNATRRSIGSANVTVDVCGQSVDFLDWAERYVNQLDPLHPAPHDPDFEHERSWQYGSEEKRFTEELQRLLGHRWKDVEKLV